MVSTPAMTTSLNVPSRRSMPLGFFPAMLAAFAAGCAPAASTVDAVAPDAVAPDAVAPDAVAPDVPSDVSSLRTVLRVHYPVPPGVSLSVRGSGEGLTWERGLSFTREADGVYAWSSDSVRAPIEWKPLLDDRTWSRGPNYRARAGTTIDVYPHFTTQVGSFSRRWPSFHSNILANDRGVWLYLPPSYEENPLARFPVVYMHDGQNVFDPATAFGGVAWMAQDAMNAGAEDGTIREAIVVAPENTSARIAEYTPTRDATEMAGGRGDLYLRFLAEELRPTIDREFHTLAGPENTAIMGSSLGGLISAIAGVRMPTIWGLVGVMSPSVWWDNRMLLGEVMGVPLRSVRALRVYVDSGDSGPSMDGVANTRLLADVYRGVGYRDGVDFAFVIQPGATHSETYWRQRLPGALRHLLGPGR